MHLAGLSASWTVENIGSVVVTTSQYPDLVAVDLVDESMFLIDASRPTTLQVVSQRLRLA
jgi:hypothetical protein